MGNSADTRIKCVRNRDCFTVSIDYREIAFLNEAAKENSFLVDYWENHPVTLVFISVDDKEVHENEPDDYKAYYSYIGDDGDDNLFDLGAWGGTREQISELLGN